MAGSPSRSRGRPPTAGARSRGSDPRALALRLKGGVLGFVEEAVSRWLHPTRRITVDDVVFASFDRSGGSRGAGTPCEALGSEQAAGAPERGGHRVRDRRDSGEDGAAAQGPLSARVDTLGAMSIQARLSGRRHRVGCRGYVAACEPRRSPLSGIISSAARPVQVEATSAITIAQISCPRSRAHSPRAW